MKYNIFVRSENPYLTLVMNDSVITEKCRQYQFKKDFMVDKFNSKFGFCYITGLSKSDINYIESLDGVVLLDMVECEELYK